MVVPQCGVNDVDASNRDWHSWRIQVDVDITKLIVIYKHGNQALHDQLPNSTEKLEKQNKQLTSGSGKQDLSSKNSCYYETEFHHIWHGAEETKAINHTGVKPWTSELSTGRELRRASYGVSRRTMKISFADRVTEVKKFPEELERNRIMTKQVQRKNNFVLCTSTK